MLTLAAEGAVSLKSMAFTVLLEGSNTVINPPLMRERERERERERKKNKLIIKIIIILPSYSRRFRIYSPHTQ